MAFFRRRRYVRRRRTFRRRPRFSRRTPYRTKMSRKRGAIAYFKEKYMSVQISTNTAVTLDVSLNEIAAANLAAYQALYRSFKITGVKLTFYPDYGGNEYNQAIANNVGAIGYSGVNRLTLIRQTARDLVAPSSEADALETQNCIQHTFTNGRPFSLFFKYPHFVNDLEAATEYTFKTGWLSTANGTDVNHNVASWWMQSEGTGSNPYRVLNTLYFKCKDPI